MELGGHAPFLIFGDAPLDEAVRGAVGAKFATSGQDCLAANRIYVRAAREETFGPVAAVLPFHTEAEVVARANAGEMGLAAYLYTQDLGVSMRVTEGLEFGMVAVNTHSFTGASIPFGGFKQSGLGREGSRQGLLDYMEHKYVCIGVREP